MRSQRERPGHTTHRKVAAEGPRQGAHAGRHSRHEPGNLEQQRNLKNNGIGDRAEFMARLHEMSSSTAIEMLGERAHDCPYIETWFERHSGSDAETLERMARRYGGVPGPASPDQLLDALRARLRTGIAHWNRGADISRELALVGLPESARAVAAEDGIAGAIAGDETQARRVAAELGEGKSIASSANALGAIGGAIPEARVHTDAKAARLARKADARAFTIGRDVVLAADAPRPGSLAGDTLLAHELAHVQQQTAGSSTFTAGESDANLAGVRLIAARLGMPVSIGRRLAGTRLSLQRCKSNKPDEKDVPKEGGITGGDAAVGDAAVDAAAPLPPGKRSWVASTVTKATKSGEVTGKDFATLEDAAVQFGGDPAPIVKLLEKFNPGLNPNRIGPTTKYKVPTSIEIPQTAEMLPDDVDKEGSVAYWTWKVEEDAGGAEKSRVPSVPSDSSGVTLGHGYDMKARKADEIETELLAAGIDAKLAKKYRGAAGKSGKEARKWIKNNKPFDPITADQEKLLFLKEYQATTNAVIAETLAKPELGVTGGYQQVGTELKLDIDLAKLNPVILAFVVDLRFRGDLKKGWPYIKDAVKANDLEKLKELVGDIPKHKRYFYNNFVRYDARCKLVGVTPKDKETFDKS